MEKVKKMTTSSTYRSNYIKVGLLLSFICWSTSSCVSKKKYNLALLQAQEETTRFQAEMEAKNSKIKKAEQDIDQLQLQLAEAKGENNILLLLRKELQEKISGLKGNIQNISSRSSSTQETLAQKLTEKKIEIEHLQTLLHQVDQTLERNTQLLGVIAGNLRQELEKIVQDQYFIETGLDAVKLTLLTDLIFKANSLTKLNDLAYSILEKTAEVLSQYPSMNIEVIGHSNTGALLRRSNIDKWNESSQRAAVIVRLLTDEFDLNPSQVVLSSKSEFSPRASNETAAGKKENERIVISIAPRSEDLARAIKKVIEKK